MRKKVSKLTKNLACLSFERKIVLQQNATEAHVHVQKATFTIKSRNCASWTWYQFQHQKFIAIWIMDHNADTMPNVFIIQVRISNTFDKVMFHFKNA